MEIYNGTGVLKTGTLRVTKSVWALLIMADVAFEALLNEKITAHIERANGDNEEIATNISLKAFISTSVLGEGKVIDNGASFSALCELTSGGAIDMAEDETLVLSFSDLRSAQAYEIHGIEAPVISPFPVKFTEKVLLAGQKNRKFEVTNADEAHLTGDFTKVRITYPTDEGDRTVEYTKTELRAITADLGLVREGSNAQIANTLFSVVGATYVEIFADNQVNLVLRDAN